MMLRTARLQKLLAATAIVLAAGCDGDDNRIPPDTKSAPVSPIFVFLDVRTDRPSVTAGSETAANLTIQANFADTGAPVANGTRINLSTTLGSFDEIGGGSTLAYEIFGGVGQVRFYAPQSGTGGTARIRAEMQGIIDTVEINVNADPDLNPPEPAPTASTISLQPSPTQVSEAEETTEVTLFAVVSNNEGNPQGGAPVNFTTEVGALASGGSILSTNGNGEVTDTLTVTGTELEAISGSSFTVTAVLGTESGTRTDSFEISILRAEDPDEATTVTVSTNPTTVQETDDGAQIDIDAIVRDQLGDFFDGEDVQFTTELGTLSDSLVPSAGGGQASTTLTLSEAAMAAFPNDTFEVTATIGTSNGPESAQATITIVRPAPEGLEAAFSFSAPPDVGGGDPVVEFFDESTGSPTSWAWDLDGDGFADDSDVANPTFDYSARAFCDVITVTLIVTKGGDTDTTSQQIQVQPCV